MRGESHLAGQTAHRARRIVRASCGMPSSMAMVTGSPVASERSALRVSREQAALPRGAAIDSSLSTVKNSRLRASLGDRYMTEASFVSGSSSGSMFSMRSPFRMGWTRREGCAILGRSAVNTFPEMGVAGAALAAASSINAISNANLCMITPTGCDHAMRAFFGQVFLCGKVSWRACSIPIATTLSRAAAFSGGTSRKRRASAVRARHPAIRSRTHWSSPHRNSARVSIPSVYRNTAISALSGGVLVSVIRADYRTEMGVFHGPTAETRRDLNPGTGIIGNFYPRRGH